MSLLEDLRQGITRKEITEIAVIEKIEDTRLLEDVLSGHTVIIKSAARPNQTPLGVGKGLRTKVNANIGTSDALRSAEEEMLKLDAAVQAGADAAVNDLAKLHEPHRNQSTERGVRIMHRVDRAI